MVNRVVSTKMTEEEHGKIVELCNDIGISVSAMVKQAIRDRMKKEEKEKKRLELNMKKISQRSTSVDQNILHSISVIQNQSKGEINHEERYLYF